MEHTPRRKRVRGLRRYQPRLNGKAGDPQAEYMLANGYCQAVCVQVHHRHRGSIDRVTRVRLACS